MDKVGLFRTIEIVQDELLHPLSHCLKAFGITYYEVVDVESFSSATVSADNRQNPVGKLPFHSSAVGWYCLKLQEVDKNNLP